MPMYVYVVTIKLNNGEIIKIGKVDQVSLTLDSYKEILQKNYDSLEYITEVDKVTVDLK